MFNAKGSNKIREFTKGNSYMLENWLKRRNIRKTSTKVKLAAAMSQYGIMQSV